jgi:hypothetical protein
VLIKILLKNKDELASKEDRVQKLCLESEVLTKSQSRLRRSRNLKKRGWQKLKNTGQ